VSPSQQPTLPHPFHPFGRKQTSRGKNATRSIKPQAVHLKNAATQSKRQLKEGREKTVEPTKRLNNMSQKDMIIYQRIYNRVRLSHRYLKK